MVAMTPFLMLADEAPFVSIEAVSGGGDVVVLAPHPDDETLGCGAAIAALTARGHRVQVVVVTDGSRSHPNSLAYPAEVLAKKREQEVTDAVAVLTAGHGPAPVFLRYPDMAAPDGTEAAEIAAQRLLPLIGPTVTALWSTWAGDPHDDHARTARLAAVIGQHKPHLQRWSYPIWGRFRTDDPQISPASFVRLHLPDQLERKKHALAQHRTQMTWLIADDPEGFVMPEDKQEHFLTTPEIFMKEPA